MKKLLKSMLSICMLLCVAFSLTACSNDGNTDNSNPADEELFACSGKTFVYDSWETNVELSEGDRLIYEGNVLNAYGTSRFEFDASGTYIWRNEDHITSQGNWEISEDHVNLIVNEEVAETLHIVGTKFYVVQPMGEGAELHIYYKLSV